MYIDSIKNGIVIDHITAGKALEIYRLLNLEALNCTVAILKNVPSKKLGKKDIIKIDEEIETDLDVIGYIDPGVTVNIIKNSELVEKKHLELPAELTNVIMCKNPRCITTTEQELPHIFRLADRGSRIYRCIYCESKA